LHNGHITIDIEQYGAKILSLKKQILQSSVDGKVVLAMDGSPIHFELVQALSDTTRGSGGFGSTGK